MARVGIDEVVAFIADDRVVLLTALYVFDAPQRVMR